MLINWEIIPKGGEFRYENLVINSNEILELSDIDVDFTGKIGGREFIEKGILGEIGSRGINNAG